MIYDKICDRRERNVTIRSKICTTNIRSLGFRDTRELVSDIMEVDITEFKVYNMRISRPYTVHPHHE